MNRNSYDFSLAETSSLAQVDPDQNPSWINLKSLKDIIHQSTTERGSSKNQQKSNSNYNSRSLLPPQINSASNKANKASMLRTSNNNLGNKENHNKNISSLVNSKKNNNRGSNSTRQLYNPSELLNFDNTDDSEDYNTFTTQDQNEISNSNACAILKRLSNQIEPIDTQLNYYSHDNSQCQQLQTQVMNHIDTPQSIMIPADMSNMQEFSRQGHEIESILKDEIIGRIINSDESSSTPNILTSLQNDAQYESQSSPYGKTQEFDITNMNNNEECLNYIQSLTNQDDNNTDNKTEIGQITHRVEQNLTYIIGSDDITSQNSQQDSNHQRSLSGNNFFKRQKNQPSQARESIPSRQSIDIKQINLDKQSTKQGQIIQYAKKTSQLIDLTKRSFDNFQPQKSVVINLFDNQEDKENQNPYQTHTGTVNNQQKLEDQLEHQRMRIVDKEFDQFCDQIEKMRSQNVPSITITNINEVSFKRNKQMKSVERTQQQQDTPQKLTSHQSFELSESQSIKSPLSNSTSQNILINNTKDNLQQSPAPQIDTTLQQSFKRSRPNKHLRFVKQQQNDTTNNSKQFDVSQIEQQSSILDMSIQSNIIQDEMQQIYQKQRLELLNMKKENKLLQRMLEQQKRDHQTEIDSTRQTMIDQQNSKLKEQEDEYQIIIEGMKQEYEDKINEIHEEQKLKIQQLQEEHQREIMYKQDKIEKKRDKLYKLRDSFDEKRKEYNAIIIELEAYKSKVEEMTQYQLQNDGEKEVVNNNRDSVGNIFMTSQSCDNLRLLNSNKNQAYFTSRDSDAENNLDNLHPFRNSDHKQPTPYQSFDNFIDLKKRQNADNNLDIPNIIKSLQTSNNNVYNSNSSNTSNGINKQNNISQDPYGQHMHYYFSLSQVQQQQQQEDSAMNFSFSEVKTSFDNKSSCFYGDNNKNAINSGSKDAQTNIVIDHQIQQYKKFSILDTIDDQNSDEDDETQRNDIDQSSRQQLQDEDIENEEQQKTNSIPQYESDSDNNDIKKYLDSCSQAQTDSHKTASLNQQIPVSLHSRHPSDQQQHISRIDHTDLEPQTENYIDDEDEDHQHSSLEEEEESKSNLSYKFDDITTTNSNNNTNKITNLKNQSKTKQQNIIYTIDDEEEGKIENGGLVEGSENAPEDSGFLSEDGDQERIVNESSLYQEDDFNQSQNLLACTVSADPYLLYSDAFEEVQDPYLIMTGRSESAMDDDDNEIEGISKCKAINSSYINLKRNNLLIGFARK